jgi:hypothetical protein
VLVVLVVLVLMLVVLVPVQVAGAVRVQQTPWPPPALLRGTRLPLKARGSG